MTDKRRCVMKKRVPAERFPISDYIQEELDARGWTHEALSAESRLSLARIDGLLANKRPLTRIDAHGLGNAFGTGPEIWLNLDAAGGKHG